MRHRIVSLLILLFFGFGGAFAQKVVRNLHELSDPGLHLFLDDEEVQDHPGFVRKVQNSRAISHAIF